MVKSACGDKVSAAQGHIKKLDEIRRKIEVNAFLYHLYQTHESVLQFISISGENGIYRTSVSAASVNIFKEVCIGFKEEQNI